jgi:hypothetical protein
VQFEIGPQKETKAIGSSSANKRNVKPSHLKEIEKAERVEKVKNLSRVSIIHSNF